MSGLSRTRRKIENVIKEDWEIVLTLGAVAAAVVGGAVYIVPRIFVATPPTKLECEGVYFSAGPKILDNNFMEVYFVPELAINVDGSTSSTVSDTEKGLQGGETLSIYGSATDSTTGSVGIVYSWLQRTNRMVIPTAQTVTEVSLYAKQYGLNATCPEVKLDIDPSNQTVSPDSANKAYLNLPVYKPQNP